MNPNGSDQRGPQDDEAPDGRTLAEPATDPLRQFGYELVREVIEEAEEEAPPKTSSIPFPAECLVGSLGDFARVMSEGSEVPPEFYFACGLTMVGAIAADRLKLELSFEVEPRLYTVLLGESYRVKKSTALKHSVEFFGEIARALGYRTHAAVDGGSKKSHERDDFGVLYGVASAEGLTRCFQQCRSLVLAYDELRALIDKATITGSSLLPAVTS
jgi:hypothetical protein